MKKNIIRILIVSIGILFTSCSSWLDVTPPSQIREEEQFSTVEGFQQALIGCYMGMTDEMLYGRALTWSTIELMAGQYVDLASFGAGSNDYYISKFKYTSSNAIKYIDGIWLKSYNVIANVNNALKYIELNKAILDDVNYRLIKGELLAIRAYMHFDLMRLYGYGNLASRNDISSKYAIPYVTTLAKEMTSQLSYAQTITLLVKDLTDAVTLLEIDPLTGNHPASYYTDVNIDGFYNERQQRFNYYATSLLLARVYMWEGSSSSLSGALTLANKVIADAESKGAITWVTSTSVSKDLIMKSEHLMSLNTQDLITKTANYFKMEILGTDYQAQYVSNNRMMSVYETAGAGATDFRFSKLFTQNTAIVDGANAYTPLKYYGTGTTSTTTSVNNYIPLIRIPEAYYIAAECYLKQSTPNLENALALLNTVRQKRGITTDLSGLDATGVMDEIVKEYAKEYYCEGVMFFLYKRLGFQTIPGYSQTAGDDIYLLPYPSTELQMGRQQ